MQIDIENYVNYINGFVNNVWPCGHFNYKDLDEFKNKCNKI